MSKVLCALGGALPDERPLLSLQIVESVAKCPTGYWPVSRTYDEDADAGLLRQNGLFGKKPSHYICLSKSEGVPGYVMDGMLIVGEREPAPAGFSVAGRAGKRRLCTRVSRVHAIATPPVTDVIVCSKMRTAPKGFILAGEINGKVVCYKLSGGSTDASPTHYENVVAALTPDANRSSIQKLYESFKLACSGSSYSRLRPTPERPKKSPLVSEMNGLSVQPAAVPCSPRIEEFITDHDYESLNPAYNLNLSKAPTRAAPRPPAPKSPAVQGGVSPSRRCKSPAPLPPGPHYSTLGGYSGMDGVPFLLNPRLRGLPSDTLTQLPVIKTRTCFDLDRDYNYTFTVERQT